VTSLRGAHDEARVRLPEVVRHAREFLPGRRRARRDEVERLAQAVPAVAAALELSCKQQKGESGADIVRLRDLRCVVPGKSGARARACEEGCVAF